MIAVEEQGHKVIKSKCHNRRCYAVKVCIEKNPQKNVRGNCRDPCVRVQKQTAPGCPSQLPPLRAPVPICNPCGPTQCPPPPPRRRQRCNKQDTDIQCSLGFPKNTQDTPCQTPCMEQKHCGHQTTICCQKSVNQTQQCQTELEASCCVEGVAHDRKACSKPCCSNGIKKRDASCQPHQPPPLSACGTQTISNNCRPKSRRRGGNRPACEQRHTFPFVGRTPSGNLKVCPRMVSYENKEFGILVANPNSMRTSVKRITSCDAAFEEENLCPSEAPATPPPPPPPPPLPPRPPPPCLPKYFCCREISSPCSSAKDSCQTAQDRPLPRFRQEIQSGIPPPPIHHRNHRGLGLEGDNYKFYRGDLEWLQASYYPNKFCTEQLCYKTQPVVEQSYYPRNEVGHTDSWNYVNPKYRAHHEGNPQPGTKMGYEHRDRYNETPKYPNSIHSENQSVQHRHNARTPPGMKPLVEEEPSQQFEGYLDTGLQERQHANLEEAYNHSYSESKGHPDFGGIKRGVPEHTREGYYAQPAPYIPAFPQENMNRNEYHYPMSDADGYHTPTEIHEVEDGKLANNEAVVRSGRKPRHIQQDTRPQIKSRTDEEDPKLVGKLHYLVKGTVASDAKIRVGDAVFPVQSVVLEIRSKLSDTEGIHGNKMMDTAILPDFNSLGIRRSDSDQESARLEEMITVEDEATMTCKGACDRKLGGNNGVPTHPEYLHWDDKLPSTSGVPPHSSHYVTSDAVIDAHSNNRSLPSALPPGYDQHHSGEKLVDNQVHPQDVETVVPCQPCRSNYNFHPSTKSPFSEDLLLESAPSSRNPDNLPTEPTLTTHPSTNSRNPTLALSTGGGMLAESTLDFVIPTAADPPVPMPRRTSKEVQQATEDVGGIMPNLDVIHGAVLTFGGINSKVPYSNENSAKEVLMYTRESDDWTKMGELPVPRTHFGLARVENDVYIIGGLDPEHRDHYGKGMSVQTNLRLNLRSGKWDLVKGLEQARSHFGCVAIGKHIFVIGGNIESRATSTCLVFNVENQTWNTIASLDCTRSNMGIVVYKDGILVAGGTNKDVKQPVLATVMYYEPQLNSWTPWKSLPSPRAFCSLAVMNNQNIYLIAGAGLKDVSRRKNSSLADVLHFDEKVNEWVHAGVLRHARHGQSTTVLDNNIVVIAGISSHVVGPINSVEIWSPSTGNAEKVKNFPHHRSGVFALTL